MQDRQLGFRLHAAHEAAARADRDDATGEVDLRDRRALGHLDGDAVGEVGLDAQGGNGRVVGHSRIEGTAIEVHGDTARVIGKSKVAVYDPNYKHGENEPAYYFLSAGDQLDLKERRKQ